MNENQKNDGVSVKRYFEYKDDSLYMYSKVPGEFKDSVITSFIRFSPDSDSTALSIYSGTTDQDCPLEVRVGELNYLLSLSLLFNPKNKTDYGVPQTFQEDLP